jgi:enamine deaminase RidA (YjgF/YER057c/UK114 family)
VKQRHASPKGHWTWPIKVNHQQGVRSGQMIWIGAQGDLAENGQARHGGDLNAQIESSIENISRVLKELGSDLTDLVKLLCFYVNDGSVDEQAFLAQVGKRLPPGTRPAVTAVPVPYLAYPGMLVEIEGYAMRGEDDRPLPRSYAPVAGLSPLPTPFVPALRCGKMIFVSGQTPVDEQGRLVLPDDVIGQTKQVMRQVGQALKAFGADFADAVKLNRWYVGHGTVEDFEPASLACAAHFSEPGPAATGIPLPRHALPGHKIRIEIVAMLGEDGKRLKRRHAWPDTLWDWTIKLPYHHGLKCHDMIFLGGQVSLDKQGRAVDPDDLAAQTRQAMIHIGSILKDLGADYRDVCKSIAVYEAPSGPEERHKSLSISASFFPHPGPATTGIPLPKLAYPRMVTEIDVFAMTDPD